MKACSTSSGGVMFVPDELEYTSRPTKYAQFVEQEDAKEKVGVFGKKKPRDEDGATKAA